MQQYKMSFLDRMGFVVTTRSYDAATDAEAMQHAHTICGTHKIMVTEANRVVGSVEKGASA